MRKTITTDLLGNRQTFYADSLEVTTENPEDRGNNSDNLFLKYLKQGNMKLRIKLADQKIKFS